MSTGLDLDALYTALDRRRREQRYSWQDVSRESGVSKSLLSRIAYGTTRPSADNLVRLFVWLGEYDLAPYVDRYMEKTEEQG